MKVVITHVDGRVVTVPATQVVVCTDGDKAVAVSFEHQTMIVHTDATRPDFAAKLAAMRLPERVKAGG